MRKEIVMREEIYQQLTDFRLSHHTLVKVKHIEMFNEYVLREIEWLLEYTSDNLFVLVNDSNKNLLIKYINKNLIYKRLTLVEFNDNYIENSCLDNFIEATLFIKQNFNKPSWFYIGNFDAKYNNVIKRYLKGGRKYRLNLVCLDNDITHQIEYMFDHHINI